MSHAAVGTCDGIYHSKDLTALAYKVIGYGMHGLQVVFLRQRNGDEKMVLMQVHSHLERGT